MKLFRKLMSFVSHFPQVNKSRLWIFQTTLMDLILKFPKSKIWLLISLCLFKLAAFYPHFQYIKEKIYFIRQFYLTRIYLWYKNLEYR